MPGSASLDAAPPTFSGFRPAAFKFFRDLARHNDPNWFKPRKAVYETEVLAPFREFVLALSHALQAAGISLVGDPDRGIFRIYRDVRFSPDKRLYKTHAAAVLTRSGGKKDPGLLYVHLEPGGSMAGVGFWHPEPGLLTRLRRALIDDPDEFLGMIGRLEECGHKVTTDAQLSRIPRGFEAMKDSPVASYLCWKTLITEISLSDTAMQSSELVGRIVDFTAAAMPLLEWGWAAADQDLPPPLVLNIPARPLPKPDF
jgi:uncharacterized protein (TIGR02453 family)